MEPEVQRGKRLLKLTLQISRSILLPQVLVVSSWPHSFQEARAHISLGWGGGVVCAHMSLRVRFSVGTHVLCVHAFF